MFVKFTKPTIRFAPGDIEEIDKEYKDTVLDPYIKRYFDAGDDQDRYEEVEAPVAVEETPEEVEAPTPAKAPTREELDAQAIELGIDPTEYKNKADLADAIATA